jgi:RNA polymerase sigma-70 factor, ECF subfamily
VRFLCFPISFCRGVNRFGQFCYKLYENLPMRIFRPANNSRSANTREEPDRVLLERFRRQDRAAFDTLFARYGGAVLTFAQYLTGCRSDAEDLMQETFLAAYRGAEGYKGGSLLLTWLLGITLRRFRDSNRRPRPALLPLFEETDTTDGVSTMEQEAITAIVFRQAVDALDTPLREAFLLVTVQGLTHTEAAEILEAPVGTVKWRVAEAAKRLRAAWNATEETSTAERPYQQHSDQRRKRKSDVPEIQPQ